MNTPNIHSAKAALKHSFKTFDTDNSGSMEIH